MCRPSIKPLTHSTQLNQGSHPGSSNRSCNREDGERLSERTVYGRVTFASLRCVISATSQHRSYESYIFALYFPIGRACTGAHTARRKADARPPARGGVPVSFVTYRHKAVYGYSNHPALRKQAESRGSGFSTRQQHPASFLTCGAGFLTSVGVQR